MEETVKTDIKPVDPAVLAFTKKKEKTKTKINDTGVDQEIIDYVKNNKK